MRRSPPWLVLALASVLTGCAYRGDIGSPVSRKLNWFSYAGGEDIRADCAPGFPDRYRLIYNAVWNEQVRAYDILRSYPGTGAMFSVNVFQEGPNLALGINPLDITAPWRAKTFNGRLDEAEFQGIVRALRESGIADPSPEGLRLYSFEFYWLATACIDGRFHLAAWEVPSERFARTRFAEALRAADQTGVPFNPARPVNRAEGMSRMGHVSGRSGSDFELMVGRNRLVGLGSLF